MTTFYVIRHKPSGVFMPARLPSSSFEFNTDIGAWEPRLFFTKRAAENCATCWAKGVWSKHTGTESDGWEHPSYIVDYPPTPDKVAGRRREDLEVICAELQLMEPQ